MSGSRFTIVDCACSFVVVAVLLCVLQLPGCGNALSSARKTARQMQNSTHVRGIQSGMVLFAQGNKDHYPGLDSTGGMAITSVAAAKDTHGSASTNGFEPVYRMATLLRGNYFSPEYAVSPQKETDPKTLPTAGVDMTTENFSYAMLRIDGAKSSDRLQNWKANNKATAPVVSDRNTGSAAGAKAASIHDPKQWIGSVCFNDNHAEFKTSNTFDTMFGASLTSNDDLFADNRDYGDKQGNDAAMVYQDATTYVNQK